jgi:exportin-2 (importin alpha re-exporter)
VEIFPALINHLGSNDPVVYTWAAYSIEKILAVEVNGAAMVSSKTLAPFLAQILTGLFDLIEVERTPKKAAKNDHLMRGYQILHDLSY